MSPPIDPRIELLPGQLRPVAELCGFDGVELLIKHFGGLRIYIGKVDDSREIAAKCGTKVMAALREYYGGDYVVVPLARALAVARKHQAIRFDDRPASVVARLWGMSVNSVYRIRGAGPGPVEAHLSRPPKRRVDAGVVDLEELIDRSAKP